MVTLIELDSAITIMTNPYNLIFRLSSNSCFIRLDDETDEDFFMELKFPPENGHDFSYKVGSFFRAVAKSFENEMRNGGSFLGLLEKSGKSIHELNLLSEKDIDKIEKGLRKKGIYKT